LLTLHLQLVLRSDVVEMHDVTSRDPKLLVHLKVSSMLRDYFLVIYHSQSACRSQESHSFYSLQQALFTLGLLCTHLKFYLLLMFK